MNQPEMYSRVNDLQRRDVQKVLQNSIKLMQFSETDCILEIGCACGDSTKEILLKHIPLLKHLVAIDISKEMIKFATSQNAHPQISYVQMDISCKTSILQFSSHFDHIISFYTFHWINQQQQLFENIFAMLKPGGDSLSLFILKCDLKHIYKKLVYSSKWKQYMGNVKEFVFPYQESQNPVKDLEAVFGEIGFAHIIKTEEYRYVYNNIKEYVDSMEPLMPFVGNIPREKRDEFMEDFVQFSADYNYISSPVTPQSEVIMPYLTAVVYLRKPN